MATASPSGAGLSVADVLRAIAHQDAQEVYHDLSGFRRSGLPLVLMVGTSITT